MDHIIELGGGLVDTGSPATVHGAHLKDCLNYERGIEAGYTRSDGFARWDGRRQAYTEYYRFTPSNGTFTDENFAIGDTVTFASPSGSATATILYVIPGDGVMTYIDIVAIDGTIPASGVLASVTGVKGGLIEPASGSVINYTLTLQTTGASYTTIYNAIRADIDPLPISTVGKIAGAHFFRNRLYVVADYAAFTVTSLNTLNLKEGAVVRKVTGSAVIGTLVGFTDVEGDVQAGGATSLATLMVRSYTGVVPTVGDDIEIQSDGTNPATYTTIGDFGAFVQSPRAGLFYADYNGTGGWNEVTAGRRFRYYVDSSCTGDPFTAYTRSGFSEDVTPIGVKSITVEPSEVRAGEFSSWASSGSQTLVEALADVGTDAVGTGLGTGGGGSYTGPITIRFGASVAADLPRGAVVTGIKVTIVRANTASVGAIRDFEVSLVGLATASANKADTATIWPVSPPGPTVWTTVDYGGELDTWGTRLQTELLIGDDFGVRFSAQQPAPTLCNPSLDQVAVTLYYREQTQDIYIYSGSADVEQVKVIYHTVDQGTFNAKDAQGTLIVDEMASVYARASDIGIGYQLRTGASGGGALLGYVNSVDELTTLPSSDILADAGSRWTFTTCDPFAVDDADIMIACSGVEEAYGFDGDYLLPIATGLSPVREIPRHAAFFQNQLFLGYAVGIVQASDVGAILAYSGGEAGAVELGLSDRITGLLPLRGQALAVFTERTIRTIYSDGGGNFTINIVSNSSGAIEYTCVDMGIPVFADFRGLATLSAVQEYGDFQRGRLSNKATRLMLSRLQYETRNQTVDKRPLCALAIRNKNQCRLYCRDGYVITLTLAGDQLDPNITLQRLFINGANSDANSVRVLALAAGVTDEGRDVAFFTADNQSTMWPYVYQIDAGRSYDTGAIVAHIELHPDFGPTDRAGALSRTKRWDRMNVFGKAHGSASLTCKVGASFTSPSAARSFVLGSTSNTVGTDPETYNAPVELGIDAKGLSLRFDSSTATELPHTIQVLDLTINETLEKQR
jgi:hypothetical protein